MTIFLLNDYDIVNTAFGFHVSRLNPLTLKLRFSSYLLNNLYSVKSCIFPTLKSGTSEPFVTSSFLTSPGCFDKQLTQQGQIHPYVFILNTDQILAELYQKKRVQFWLQSWW